VFADGRVEGCWLVDDLAQRANEDSEAQEIPEGSTRWRLREKLHLLGRIAGDNPSRLRGRG
jgi:hypothetical protein